MTEKLWVVEGREDSQRKPMKILDIGCGDKKIKGAIGIDLNYETDHVMDLDEEKIPYVDGTFDIVISRDSIEHFGNPKHIFKEVKRVLKKGGIFHIETVNVGVFWIRAIPIDWNKGWRHKLNTKRTGHLIHWTPDTLKMWYEIHGFKVTKNMSHSLLRYKIEMEGTKQASVATKKVKEW